MHYLGILGVPRRYYAYGDTDFIPESAHTVNEASPIVGADRRPSRSWCSCSTWSGACARPAGRQQSRGVRRRSNGRRRTRRRSTATGVRKLPVVYRWAYDYSVPGAPEDFIPQNEPLGSDDAGRHGHGTHTRERSIAVIAALRAGIVGLVARRSPADREALGDAELADDRTARAASRRRRRASACGCSSRS